MQTTKLTLVLAVGLIAMATLRTGAASIARIDGHNGDALTLGLVFDEGAQLEESPTVVLCSLPPPNRYSQANALEVFKCDPSRCAFSDDNELFADNVVDVRPEARLAPADALQDAFAGTRSFPLESLACLRIATADLLNSFAAVHSAITISSQVDDSHVHAEEVVNFYGRRFLKLYCAVEEEQTASINKIALPTDASQVSGLIFAEDVGNHQPAGAHRQDANTVAVFEGQEPLIVGHRPGWPEDGTFPLVPRKTLCRFGDGADSHLRGQAEAFAAFSIGELLNRWLAEYSICEALLGSERSGFVVAAHRIEQGISLFECRQQFQLECKFHASIIGSALLPNKASRQRKAKAKAQNLLTTGAKAPWLPEG